MEWEDSKIGTLVLGKYAVGIRILLRLEQIFLV